MTTIGNRNYLESNYRIFDDDELENLIEIAKSYRTNINSISALRENNFLTNEIIDTFIKSVVHLYNKQVLQSKKNERYKACFIPCEIPNTYRRNFNNSLDFSTKNHYTSIHDFKGLNVIPEKEDEPSKDTRWILMGLGDNTHWEFCIYDALNNKYHLYDSLKKSGEHMKEKWELTLTSLYSNTLKKLIDGTNADPSYEMAVGKKIQTDGYNCGVYVCLFAYFFLREIKYDSNRGNEICVETYINKHVRPALYNLFIYMGKIKEEHGASKWKL